MIQTGLLKILRGESRLDGTLLAREGESDAPGAATAFLQNRNLVNNQRIQVTGTDGVLGSTTVIYITDAQAADASLMETKVQAAPKKAAEGSGRTAPPPAATPAKKKGAANRKKSTKNATA